MDSLTEMQREYLKRMKEEELEELSKNSELIEAFKAKCSDKGVILTDDNFRYIYTIGIIATYPNILNLLNDKVMKDKEELVDCTILDSEYRKEKFISGFLYHEDYMAMAHPFFRRGFSENANYAPRFIDLFWHFENPEIETYLSLDFNRVRVNVDRTTYMELDTWYGAKFDREISQISDGISKLRPPLDLEDFDIQFFFSNAYSLDTKWETKNNIKSFQSEEFKTEEVKIKYENEVYYPVRYIHAEYDLEVESFRHFDGAIHFYTEDEYYQRRDSDFNFNEKDSKHIKTKSLKLFKMNGIVDVDTWIEFSSHFMTGNPLVFEYFEGKYPDRINEIIEIRRKKPAANKVQNGK